MNNRTNKYAFLALLAAGLGSCASEDFWETFDRTVDGPIDFTVGIESSVAQHSITRAGQEDALSSDTKICIKVDGKWASKDISKTALCSLNGSAIEYDENNTLYWDDYGVGDPANKTNNDAGLSVLGVAIDSQNTPPTPSDWTSMEWNTIDDKGQTEVSSSKLDKDIIISNNLSTSKYTFANRNTPSAKNLLFVHPLSKITFNITAGKGFTSGFQNDPTLKLVNKDGTAYAFTTGTISISGGSATKGNNPSIVEAGITSKSTDKKNYVMQALVYPDTPLGTNGTDVIAVLSVDGNNYYIKAAEIQSAMDGKGQNAHTTVANYNYVISVTVDKTDVSLMASVTNWDKIAVDGKAEIIFNANVTSSTTDNTNTTSLNDNDEFTLLRSTDGSNYVDPTTCTYNSGTITCSPVRYWENGNSYFFRALAKYSGTAIVAETEKDVEQGTDLLWGTTAAHEGKESDGSKHTYAKSAVINPRTSEVPLVFKHVMSNVVITLSTKIDQNDPAYVDLSKATFELTNLSTSGTIALTDGEITADATKTSAFADGKSGVAKIMIPHKKIDDTAMLIINLHDNNSELEKPTTYSLQLNTCVDNSKTEIKKWEGGKQYNYVITITKEAVQFRVMVENWKTTTGSGNATLDWD